MGEAIHLIQLDQSTDRTRLRINPIGSLYDLENQFAVSRLPVGHVPDQVRPEVALEQA